MVDILEDGECIQTLAKKLTAGIKRLHTKRASHADVSNDKYTHDVGKQHLAYGQLSSFFDGLEGIVGPPSVSLHEAIEREHCSSADSHDEFTATNYGTKTSSCIEYHFVHFGNDGISVLLKDHRKSQRLLRTDEKDGRGTRQYPAEVSEKLKAGGNANSKARAPLSYTELEPRLMAKNDELVQLGYERMGKEEFLSARLYTGPVSAAHHLV